VTLAKILVRAKKRAVKAKEARLPIVIQKETKPKCRRVNNSQLVLVQGRVTRQAGKNWGGRKSSSLCISSVAGCSQAPWGCLGSSTIRDRLQSGVP